MGGGAAGGSEAGAEVANGVVQFGSTRVSVLLFIYGVVLVLESPSYYANEDYFVPDLRVENMPRLKRGQKLVSQDGTVHNVRLKRSLKGEEKIGNWKWSDNPFTRQRELNGLRVMNNRLPRRGAWPRLPDVPRRQV